MATRRVRASSAAAGYQSWRDLLFVHLPVASSVLRPLVPPSLALDEFDGSAFISLVTFVVLGARPFGAPPPLGLRFLETNVRTYVRLADGSEPGIFFFSLDAASVLAVIGARVTLGLPYFWAEGAMRVQSGAIDYSLRRRVGRRPGCHVRYAVGEPLGAAAPGSLAEFLVERYVLHNVRRGPTLWSVPVRHRPYPLHAVSLHSLEDSLVWSAGVAVGSAEPVVHYASGVDVAVLPPRVRLRAF